MSKREKIGYKFLKEPKKSGKVKWKFLLPTIFCGQCIILAHFIRLWKYIWKESVQGIGVTFMSFRPHVSTENKPCRFLPWLFIWVKNIWQNRVDLRIVLNDVFFLPEWPQLFYCSWCSKALVWFSLFPSPHSFGSFFLLQHTALHVLLVRSIFILHILNVSLAGRKKGLLKPWRN